MKFVCNTTSSQTEPLSLPEIENLINKTYKKYLFRPFIKAIQTFKLVEEGDKIALCLSGGKDSFLMAKLFDELKKHKLVNFEVSYICMDPGYSQDNLNLLKYNAEKLGIPLIIRKSDYFSVVEKIASDNPCYLCARMRRGFLYSFASSIGCNKIALAHHFDDCIETTLLNMFYGSQFKTMVPKIKSKNFESMQLIRPMIYIKEEDIIRFTTKANLTCLNCGCTVAAKKTASKRAEIKELLKQIKLQDEGILTSIFNSATNVVVDAVMGYTKNGVKHNFDDIYADNSSKGNIDEE
jgi:tRNA(Ile)-lysidine synthase TilS/MesJ